MVQVLDQCYPHRW